MKTIAACTCWFVATLALLYMVVRPDTGVVHHSPTTALGLGMIGLGLCRMSRPKTAAAPVKA